jgi:asparagine synthase (glutamine-hydrolysing)
MCGVFACLRPPGAPAPGFDIDAVLASLARRGPDGQGALHLPGCSLAHTRLAIFDRTGGQQPMTHADTGLVLSYNGEIYNAPELRTVLQSRGHAFRTRTDTEVVLAAFAASGPACVALFEGMFAFALWDPREGCLFVARDRMGEKPLFYSESPDGRVFVASEIKALLAAGVVPTLDIGALDYYLRWKHTPPTRSIYANVRVVPPAHVLSFRSGRLQKTRYWQIPPPGGAGRSRDTALAETELLLSDAVANRLSGDRPVGLSLSGGVDSTLIAALAAGASNKRLTSYTVSYLSGNDEGPKAQRCAAALGLRYTAIPLAEPVPEHLEAVAAYLDQPHADSANLAQAMLCACASDDVAVLLSGDGADELFWGYRWYVPPASLAQRLEQMTILGPEDRRELLPGYVSPVHEEPPCPHGSADAINDIDLDSYLGGQLLPKADLLGMMHGVEVRAPYLDYRLVEFARSLPPALKSGQPSKSLLRSLLARSWPELLPGPDKQGYGAPLTEWLGKPAFASYVRDRLSPGAKIRTLLDPQALDRQLAAAFSRPDRMNAYRIWLFLCLELWASSRPSGALTTV